jgi:hypothetical protein
MTPKVAWEAIQEYIPKDKQIWEAFYGDGTSGNHLLELGFKVIHEPIDFFENDRGEVVVSNPPFSLCNKILPRLKELNKPFILIMPSSKIYTKYLRESFHNEDIQIIIPRKRIQFVKVVDGVATNTNSCNFDCFYYCWKINLPKDIMFLL